MLGPGKQSEQKISQAPGTLAKVRLNIQPVIPARVSEHWNLVTRIITPIVFQPTVSQPINQGAYGFGDLNPSFFLSPAKPGKIIWGVGPAIVLPTATNPFLGQGKWSIGPSVVVLTQPGKWTLGALVNNAQLEQRLLHHLAAHPDSGLGSHQRWTMGGSVWWRSGENYEARIPTGESHRTVLRQRRSSPRCLALGDAITNCVLVSKVEQRATENVTAAKVEANGSGRTAEMKGKTCFLVGAIAGNSEARDRRPFA